MKFLELDSVLMLFSGLFGLVVSSFLLSPGFPVQWKIIMVVMMLGFILFCTIIQRYFDSLDFKAFKRGG